LNETLGAVAMWWLTAIRPSFASGVSCIDRPQTGARVFRNSSI
jgi:hypothetical protein